GHWLSSRYEYGSLPAARSQSSLDDKILRACATIPSRAPLCWLHHTADRCRRPLVLPDFDGQLVPSRRRKRVEARAAVVLGLAPGGLHPTLDQHALQGGIQRALFDLKHVVGRLLDVLGDAIAVHRAQSPQRSEDEHVQRAWRDVGPIVHWLP